MPAAINRNFVLLPYIVYIEPFKHKNVLYCRFTAEVFVAVQGESCTSLDIWVQSTFTNNSTASVPILNVILTWWGLLRR